MSFASSQLWRQPLFYLAAAAVVAGIYFRFHGLGNAPFAVDEYYLARSIEGVLRSGVPSFLCGGYYMRGLLLQYSAAALQLAGASAEFGPRFFCALSSVVALPAIFILGNRLQGRTVGWLAVVLCALSVWEIEIARFGRMYAPFQALFVWYMVFFLRYTVDRDRRALWPMICLSIVGPLVWEGGIFLALANLVSLFLRRWPGSLRREDWIYLVSCTLLLGLVYLFLAADFRGFRSEPLPPGFNTSMVVGDIDAVTTLQLPVASVRAHPAWLAVAVLPLLAIVFAIRRIWTLRTRRFFALGLLAILGAALIHQLLAAFSIAVLLLLTRLTNWRELSNRRLAPVTLAVLTCTLFWILFAICTVDWPGQRISGGIAGRMALLGYQFLSLPDVVAVVVRPWAHAVPHLGSVLLIFIAAAVVEAVRNQQFSDHERTLLIVLVILLLAAGASHPPREETRYVFFLYPVAIVIALSTLMRAVLLLVSGPRLVAVAVTSALSLGGFALSEDFQPRHLANINSPREMFREGMTPAMESHLIIRTDYRAVASWLQEHQSDAAVVNGVHGVDHYYPAIDYFYVDESSPGFLEWSCRQGTVERWGNYPLIYTMDDLTKKVEARPKTYFVSFSYDRDRILLSLAALHPRVVLATGDVMIIELRG